MICPNCATNNPEEARYCNHCARPLAALICGVCQGANRAQSRFCTHCGHSLAIICPNCGSALPQAAAAFCDQCGFDLSQEGPEVRPQRLPGTVAQPIRPPVQPPPRIAGQPALSRAAGRPFTASRAKGLSQLQRYIPDELMNKLQAAQASGGMVGERRVVTMLFCDVKGSTSASEHMDPEDWTEVINGAFEHMIRPVYNYEGTLARLMGDAILAFFGAPIAHEDDPQRAIFAGLDIVAAMGPYKEAVSRRFGVDFDVRVGVNTGRVVVGAVGSDLRMEYTAMGDAVNLAARMEQTAEPGTVQIAEDTYRLVKPLFEFENVGDIEIKGKRQPVTAYRVLRRKATPGRVRGIEGLDAPLIGRDAEWSRLTAAAEAVQKGVGQIVFLVGEAGLGKSRLISELKGELVNRHPARSESGDGGAARGNGEPPVAWFETSSMSYETAHPYSLFQRLLRRVMGAAETDSAEDLREKLNPLVKAAPKEEQESLGQVAEALLGLPPSNGQAPLEGESFKGQLYLVSTQLWSRLARERPTVLVCDDLHWSDPASAALLEHLFPLNNQVPLMFLCATRTDRDSPGWALKNAANDAFPHRYTEINVRPLSTKDSDRLVDSLLTIAELPGSLRDRIQKKAEGNPFFVEEVVRTLIESGSVVQTADGMRWQAMDGGEQIDIPDNLQALLTARMDRLAEDTRRVLQLAALIGRSFYYRILERIVDGESGQAAQELDRELNTLQRADLIREAARMPELEYMFRHSLTQEAAYRTILRKQRAAYHRLVGETIEALYPEKCTENAAALAHHFYEAGDKKRGFQYAVMAGDEAYRLFANTEALAQYDRAVELLDETATSSYQIIHLFTRRGRAMELNLDYRAAEANYLELAALAETRQERALELPALNLRTTIRAAMTPLNNPLEAIRMAGETLALARDMGDKAAEAKALWNRMMANLLPGIDMVAALQDGEASLAIARAHDLREQMAFTLHNLSTAYRFTGRYEDADAAIEESRQLFREMNNLPMLGSSYLEAVSLIRSSGDLDKAISIGDEGHRISQAIGNVWNLIMGYVTNAGTVMYRGDFGQALTFLDNAAAVAKGELPLTHAWAFALTRSALLTTMGQLQTAIADANKALEVGKILPGSMGWLLTQLVASLYCLNGEAERARPLLEQEEPPGPRVNDRFFGVYRYLGRALFTSRTGADGQALPIVEELVSWTRESGAFLFLPQALLIGGELHIKMGEIAQALNALEEGLTIARQQKQRPIWLEILAQMIPLVTEPTEREALEAEARELIVYFADHIPTNEQLETFLASERIRGPGDEILELAQEVLAIETVQVN